MKTPTEVEQKIAELGARVLNGESEADIGKEGAVWLREHHPLFTLVVIADWWRRRTWSRVRSRTRAALNNGNHEDAGPSLPFPELPAHLEIAPGVTKHQSKMIRRDWDSTLAIYRSRRDRARPRLTLVDTPFLEQGVAEAQPREGMDEG
jgi:hypothetical protein